MNKYCFKFRIPKIIIQTSVRERKVISLCYGNNMEESGTFKIAIVSDCPKVFVDRPKALGDIQGMAYIYVIFFRFGRVDVPENVEEKMDGKNVEQK